MLDATKSQSARAFGPFKPIGDPPAVTGPYDGFAAANPAAIPDPATLPPDDSLSDPQDQSSTSQRPGTHQECDLLNCRTVQDEGQSSNSRDSGGSGDDSGSQTQPEAQTSPGSSPTQGALPAVRQPVRG
jgi:hypothetical protein